MFYYEKKDIYGRWQPRTSPDRPTAKSESGTRQTIRNVIEVPQEMHMFDLDSLREFLVPKETEVQT
ncbi:hypothetical protein IQ03_02430 [Gemmobacter caeni]|uniref:Uncharacterized protein n=2 Tax=Gemmobacter caeni TaxID=589035 RepID=A0A2T6AZ58_9RHOB|nr:hypothetical protein C8N34_108206 [Gemmobacter caeni]TWI98904.1 hypothetical protein IQ03_02430 [Gemmobacter caeni]